MKDYEILDWDTDFFGFRVCRLENNLLLDRGDLGKIIQDLKNDDISLAYYFTNMKLDLSIYRNKYFFFDFILTRIPLSLKLNREFEFDENISFYEEDYVDKALIDLAILAGSKGRFGRDKRISKNDYSAIFKSWIINAVKNKEGILVYKINSEIVGMVTYKIKANIGYGGLIAVNPEFQGRRISSALLTAKMNVLRKKGCTSYNSGTQKINDRVLKVFKGLGVIPQKPEYVYHLWRKK